MSVTPQERNSPTREQLEETLGLLLAAAEEGQLVSLVFMLKNGDAAVVDYRGSHEFTELACRTVRERIAHEIGAQSKLGQKILDSNAVVLIGAKH